MLDRDSREAAPVPSGIVDELGPEGASFERQHSLQYYFDLASHLAHRDFSLRHKGSVLGVLWVLVFPLMQLLTLVFVFKRVIPLGIDAYPAFVFTALLPWTWFSNSLSGSGMLFVSNRDLVRRPNFPPEILILVNTWSNLLLYLVVLPLVIIMLLAYGHHITWVALLLPLFLIVESILIQGLSLIIATGNVFYRDVQQITSVVMTLLFWMTPVFYESRQVNTKYKFLFEYNPMAILIQGIRDILFHAQPPVWGHFLYATVLSIVILLIGYWVYRRHLHNVFDAI